MTLGPVLEFLWVFSLAIIASTIAFYQLRASLNGSFSADEETKRLETHAMILKVFLICSSLLWVVAVFKLFLLDLEDKSTRVYAPHSVLVVNARNSTSQEQHKVAYRSDDAVFELHKQAIPLSTVEKVIPISSEWLSVRTNKDYHINAKDVLDPILNTAASHVVTKTTKYTATTKIHLKQATELAWPPVQKDGTISKEDGNETMPIIGLEVPRFWEVPEGVDVNTVGKKVNGHETIFLMIASYRDFQCRETISWAYKRADHPERLFVAAVDQVSPGDIGCLDIEVPCSTDPTQPICVYRDQISVFKVDAMYSTGPVTARHVGDRMYRGEYFVTQMDAHCAFVRHWDTSIINQWRLTGNEMAVLR